jgi:hypothetical protein
MAVAGRARNASRRNLKMKYLSSCFLNRLLHGDINLTAQRKIKGSVKPDRKDAIKRALINV